MSIDFRRKEERIDMKRFDSSDSLGALISICPPKDDIDEDENSNKYSESNNKGYSKEFQAMLDSLEQEDCGEELFAGKKRRLSSEQVKALERYFEVENKLEPERKAKLADELGLQPRQVAIWFQNRRARWKTKQLEKDYGLLKANYNSLKLSYEDLQLQNQSLIDKVRELKEKVVCRVLESQESSESTVKEESPINSENDEKDVITLNTARDDIEFQAMNTSEIQDDQDTKLMKSSGIEEGNSLKFCLALNNSSSSSSSSSNSLMTTNWFQTSSESSKAASFPVISPFGSASEEPNCNNFFSVDQAPTLYWYFPEQ